MAADTEALSPLQKAVAAYDRMFGRQWDPRQRAALERKIGEALFRRGEYRHALESVKKALELVGDPIPVSARKLRRGIARHAVIQLTHRAVPSVFVRAKPVDDPAFEEWAALRKMLGWIDYCNNNERLLYNILSALNRSSEGAMYTRCPSATRAWA